MLAEVGTRASAKSSARERGSVRNLPSRAEVTMVAPRGADAALGHAGVLSLQHHADAPGARIGVEAPGDLHGQPLLRLRPGREVLDQAGQFGQAEDALPGR